MALKDLIIKRGEAFKRKPYEVIHKTIKPFGVSAPKTIACAVIKALRDEGYEILDKPKTR